MFIKGIRFLRYRYLFCFTALFIIGLAISIYGGLSGSAPVFAALCVCGALLFVVLACLFAKFFRIGAAAVCIVYVAAVLLGLGYPGIYSYARYGAAEEFEGDSLHIYGRIITEPKLSASGKTLGAMVRANRIVKGGKETNSNIKIYTSIPLDLGAEYGDGVEITAVLRRPTKDLNGFNYRRYLMSRGCSYTAYAEEYSEAEVSLTVWDRFLDIANEVRTKATEYCESRCFDFETGALLQGILIGSRDGFSDELYDEISAAGFMHIAAVSGLHIGFLCGIVFLLLRFLERRLRVIVAVPLLLFYIGVAAFTPSVSRAVIMSCTIMASWVLFRTPDAITSLSVSALILCVVNPFVIANVSFMMSFAATLALLLFMPPLTTILSRGTASLTQKTCAVKFFRRDKANKIVYGFILSIALSAAVSLVCQIGVMPITLHYFNSVSIMSFVGNIVVIPCTMIVFVAGLICSGIFALLPEAAIALGRVIVYPFLKIILAFAHFFSKYSYSPMHRPGFLEAVVFYALTLILLNFLTKYAEKISKSSKIPENT